MLVFYGAAFSTQILEWGMGLEIYIPCPLKLDTDDYTFRLRSTCDNLLILQAILTRLSQLASVYC